MKKYLALIYLAVIFTVSVCVAQTPYVPPASPDAIYNFNPGWKFIREHVTNAEQTDFDDSKWADVSAP